MYHQLLKRTFFLMTLSGSVMLSAGDDAWSKSGSHYSYTRTGKIAPESLPDGGIKYTFSLGCPEYPFDAGTGSCTPGDLKYSGNATRGPASGVTGTVEYGKDELPTSDTSMSMSGKLIPPEGAEGSQPTWSASATLQSPFWLEASPAIIVKAGTAVTVTANGAPTESTWSINGTEWKDHRTSGSNPYKVSSITLNRTMWDRMKWTPNPVPDGYLFPPVGAYNIAATTTEDESRTATAVIVAIQLKFITPSGDPVTNPSSSNEFVFDSSQNGVLTLNLSVEVIPAAFSEDIREGSIFQIDPIPGSTMTWAPENPNGKPTLSNGKLNATVTFTGMPQSNSSFGKKNVKLVYTGSIGTITESADYEVFYNAIATNHPNCTACPECPNWFYYYKQNAGGGSYKYAFDSESSSQNGRGESTIRIGDRAYSGDTYITTTINAQGRLKATGRSKIYKYYQYFFGVLEHERQHANNEKPGAPGGADDYDADYLYNDFEDNISKSDRLRRFSIFEGQPGLDDFLPDDEAYAGGPVEEQAIKSADTSKDWAYPGSNSKQ